MSQNFVMTFGGSGARCAEALTYLIASRSIREPVHLLVVDPDESNWNVLQTVEQLRRYQLVQAHVRPEPNTGVPPFFSTPINEGLAADSFFWANPQSHTPFSTLLEHHNLHANERALFDLLYDDSDLALTFEKGYIGRAHIGSLDLLRALRTHVEAAIRPEVARGDQRDSLQQFFHGLREATQRPGGARLLVIGSVFGGTGASGIPAIPPLLRETLLSGLQQELELGCIQLAPYFSFPQGRAEDPDSALHPLATQAALYHYALTDTGYDRVYLLGAPDREHACQANVPGGEGQKNRPHYVELGAALAAAHFFGEKPTDTRPEVYACGSDEVVWDKLPYRIQTDLRRNLVAFTTFCMLHGRFFADDLEQRKHEGSTWLKELRAGGSRSLGGQEPEIRTLRDFAKRYLVWADEMQRSHGADLFTLNGSTAVDSLGRVTPGSDLADPFHELVLRLNRVRDLQQPTGPGWYVSALTSATVDFCKANYKGWWM
jgi:hypothetical protein